MSTLSREEIRKRAVKGHILQFLKSPAVAQAAAKRIKTHLGSKVSTATVSVGESASYPGTWRISVWFIRAAELSYTNQMINRRADEAIAAAVKAAYRPTDLVDNWTRPPRRRR